MESLYLDLLKLTLTGAVFPESSNRPIERRRGTSPRAIMQRWLLDFMAKRRIQLMKVRPYDATARENGRDWPGIAYTMVGLKRLENVRHAVETTLRDGVAGDLVECGVWRGGCAIFMRAVLKAHGCKDRTVWLADSFEGLPRPDAVKYPADAGYDLSQTQYLSVPVERVQDNFRRFGLLDDQVRFLRGWFKDSLPTAPIGPIAVLRADGDLYESTMDILNALYDRVTPGGFVVIDDYGNWEPCRKAVTEFRARRRIEDPIQDIDGCGVYWRKMPEAADLPSAAHGISRAGPSQPSSWQSALS